MGAPSGRLRGSPSSPTAAAIGEWPRAAFGSRPGTSATTAGSTPATPAPVTADSREDGKAKARFRNSRKRALVCPALGEAP